MESTYLNTTEKAEGYSPVVKKFLYVYRGLLGAQYVVKKRISRPMSSNSLRQSMVVIQPLSKI